MSSYSTYEEEDELDIRVRRGRTPPMPAIYPDPRYKYRHPARPYYDTNPAANSYLVPAVSGAGIRRSRSTGHRASPPPAPVIINNRIYNEDEHERYPHLQVAPRRRSRSRSHSRVSSGSSREDEIERVRERARDQARREFEMEMLREKDLKGYELEKARRELELEFARDAERKEYERERARDKFRKEHDLEKARSDKVRKESELEKTRRELEEFKLREDRAAEEKRIKEELEFKRLREQRRAEEEKKRVEEETKRAVEEFKKKEADRIAKEKKEKDEREKEYARRLEEDLRKSGLDERQISVITKKEQAIDPNRPTYTRMSRRHLSIETLNQNRISYEFDNDPEYILIKRWVPPYEQDFLWSHTREIRERRRTILAIEAKKHHGETEFELIRKKEHKRKPSPSGLLTFLAGGSSSSSRR